MDTGGGGFLDTRNFANILVLYMRLLLRIADFAVKTVLRTGLDKR